MPTGRHESGATMKKDTLCVHSGTKADPMTRGLNTPIYPSSSFQYLDAAENVYPRYYNTPNQKAVVQKLCALEGAEDGLLFSSGMQRSWRNICRPAPKSRRFITPAWKAIPIMAWPNPR
jgi:cystathionine beta-lyase/cystathionine gamma-synthase